MAEARRQPRAIPLYPDQVNLSQCSVASVDTHTRRRKIEFRSPFAAKLESKTTEPRDPILPRPWRRRISPPNLCRRFIFYCAQIWARSQAVSHNMFECQKGIRTEFPGPFCILSQACLFSGNNSDSLCSWPARSLPTPVVPSGCLLRQCNQGEEHPSWPSI